MADRTRKKRPRDPSQLGKMIVDISVGDVGDVAPPNPKDGDKNLAAVDLGRRGGLRGGKARAAKLSAKRRSQIAKRAAKIRWAAKVD